MTEETVVLASGSPRRQEILGRMGLSFIVDAADVDERCEGEARDVVIALARRKAEAVAKRHPGLIILGADTVVVCDGEILGKPVDEADARRMLRMLSGRWHDVFTGVCTMRGGETRADAVLTQVHFTGIDNAEIDRYVATGDPMDKAGAYAIQGMAGMFIDRIDGCPHNVMGLPMAKAKELLSF